MCKTLCFTNKTAAALAGQVLKTEGNLAGLYTQIPVGMEGNTSVLPSQKEEKVTLHSSCLPEHRDDLGLEVGVQGRHSKKTKRIALVALL